MERRSTNHISKLDSASITFFVTMYIIDSVTINYIYIIPMSVFASYAWDYITKK